MSKDKDPGMLTKTKIAFTNKIGQSPAKKGKFPLGIYSTKIWALLNLELISNP